MPGPSRGQLARAASVNHEDDVHLTKDHYRLIVMGGIKVGKTSIINQFLNDKFISNYTPTLEELHSTEYEVGGNIIKLNILDTSGSYEFPAMRRLAISSADAFMLVYSIDNNESFEEIARLRELILETRPPSVPIVVVGNKCDLEEKRVVKKELAETMACIDWEHGFVECSAKINQNVTSIFKELFLQARLDKPSSTPPLPKGRRRASLPVNALSATMKGKPTRKRNSCAVS
ncbi:GTP-binding protein Di-Ras2-like [Limulus polyphemus]|uniref:GTP-binding protein Di-Ras2-like n=1 Tax=Limulus polyphemus TaxID=6850 RepID=A0ABM1T5B6_LIMPO|nr:GTP-binding protein Di-Ras2-like [Limulus polyphemus]